MSESVSWLPSTIAGAVATGIVGAFIYMRDAGLLPGIGPGGDDADVRTITGLAGEVADNRIVIDELRRNEVEREREINRLRYEMMTLQHNHTVEQRARAVQMVRLAYRVAYLTKVAALAPAFDANSIVVTRQDIRNVFSSDEIQPMRRLRP